MKIRDVVVSNDVSRAVNLDRILRNQVGIELRQVLPCPAGETHQVVRIEAADHDVVGNVVILGPRPIGVNRAAHIFKTAAFDGEAARADDVFQTGFKSQVRVFDGQAFEVVVIGGENIKKVVGP